MMVAIGILNKNTIIFYGLKQCVPLDDPKFFPMLFFFELIVIKRHYYFFLDYLFGWIGGCPSSSPLRE